MKIGTVSLQLKSIGSPLKNLRYRETVHSETSKPSFNISPWILGALQVGFSAAMRWMSSPSSVVILGLSGPGGERKRPYSRNPARGHLPTVSGFTTTGASAHFDHKPPKCQPKP